MVRKGSEAERASTMSPASAFAIRFTSGGEAPSLIFLSTRIVPAWVVYSTDSLRTSKCLPASRADLLGYECVLRISEVETTCRSKPRKA